MVEGCRVQQKDRANGYKAVVCRLTEKSIRRARSSKKTSFDADFGGMRADSDSESANNQVRRSINCSLTGSRVHATQQLQTLVCQGEIADCDTSGILKQ